MLFSADPKNRKENPVKLLPILALALISTPAFAAIQFRAPSNVPPELKELITRTVEAKCNAAFDLKEESTTVEEDRIDQGLTDYYYTTNLSGQYYFDGMHPVGVNIVVKSSLSSDSADGDIISVESDSDVCQ